MENKLVKRDINQLNESIKVMSSSSVVLLVTMLFLVLSIIIWLFAGTVTDKASIKGVVFSASGTSDISIPQAGTVRSIFIHEGQKVQAGQHIAMVSIGSAYSVLTSDCDGIVLSCKQDNESFEAFEPVATLVRDCDEDKGLVLVAFADLDNIKDIAKGQNVQIWPSNEDKDEVGYVRGRINKVDKLPIDRDQVANRIRIPEYIDALTPGNQISYQVIVNLNRSAQDPSQLDWTFDNNTHPQMNIGTLCDAIVITREYSIFEFLFLKARKNRNKVNSWIN